MNSVDVKEVFIIIAKLMTKNRDYLLELDQKFGDGDLGISMVQGFTGLVNNFPDDKDLGKVFFKTSKIFNESAPSSLGTILSFAFMGMAKELKGKEVCDAKDFIKACRAGVDNIKKRTGSKQGEKTIIDSIEPAIEAMEKSKDDLSFEKIIESAYKSANKGSESTKEMISVHGRAAYHGEKTLGIIDGGAYVGELIFKGINSYSENKARE